MSRRNKWFVNMSSAQIPLTTQCLLQLGENFSLPNNNKRKLIFEFIKSIENNIRKFPINKQMTIIDHSIPILNNLITSFHYPSQTDVQISNMVRDTKQFIKSQPNVIFPLSPHN